MLELIGRIRMDSAQAEGAIGRVTKGTEGLNISSRKAESAVKNFASVIKSGQEPVAALADSVANLSRAFGLGVGATVAIVGVVEVIKAFIYESEKLNAITDKLNSTMAGLRANANNLDFAGSINQVKALTAALKESKDQASATDGGVLGRAGKTIAGVMGLSDYNLGVAQDLAKNQIASAKAGAGIALDKRIEAMEAAKVSKFAAQNLEITTKYRIERREAELAGLSARDKEKIDLIEMNELRKVAMAEIEERGKELDRQLEDEKRQTEKINEMRIRDEEKIINLRKKANEEFAKGLSDISEKRLSGATPLIERILSASKNLGISGIEPFVSSERQKAQKKLDVSFLERFGVTGRDVTAGGNLFPSAEQKFREAVGIETASKQAADERLFESVYGIERAVIDLKRTIEDKLGVPILKSAY